MTSETDNHPESECVKLFEQFFINSEALLKIFAPEGWQNSPLFLAFHPTPQQRYEEALRFHRNLKNLFKSKDEASESKEPRFEDFLNEKPEENFEPRKEIVDLLGCCLWDVFSNNHEIVSRDGRVYDLGSFRGSAGFIADYINEHFPEISPSYDYLDFNMGSHWFDQRADLAPVYEWIFRQLKQYDCDWVYNFPRLYLIDVAQNKDEAEVDPLAYDPNQSFEQELARQKDKQEADKLREDLDRAYEDEIVAAKDKPLPTVVFAYLNVYGKLPQGWPHQ